MTTTVWLNHRFLSQRDAVIGVYNGGWLHGAGLFETMRAENGRVSRLDDHVDRLLASAAKLLAPVDRNALPSREHVNELLIRNELRKARVRLTVTAGSMQHDTDDAAADLTVCLTTAPLTEYPPEYYTLGVGVVISDHRLSPTDPLAGHKTTSYLPRLLALRRAHAKRSAEALWFTTANRLAEGCISNVFLARDGVLKTPPLDTPVLPGIARRTVIELARAEGIDVQETPLIIDDVLDADEIFLTNSIMQIVPVIRVERHDIHGGRLGTLAPRLLEAYQQRVRKECSRS